MKQNIFKILNSFNSKKAITIIGVIIITYLLFKVVSCGVQRIPQQSIIDQEGNEYRLVIIDNCEYISTPVDKGRVLTHKGNCKNH